MIRIMLPAGSRKAQSRPYDWSIGSWTTSAPVGLDPLEGRHRDPGRQVHAPQQALGEQVAECLPVGRGNAGIGGRRLEHDVDVRLRGRPDRDPAHAVGADIVAYLEAQRVAIERDRLLVIVDREEAGIAISRPWT